MKFRNFIQPRTIAEAYELAQKPDTVILGGMMWMRMQKRTVENAVDLSLLGLDKIEETGEGIRIGAYVSLRQLETSPLLLEYTEGAIKTALCPIVGVQFRNGATLGGSIWGRFGFSDVETVFTALGADVVLAGKGQVPMVEFIKNGAPKDLLTHIILPKKAPDAFAVNAHRNSATDFPVITTAVCRRGDNVRVTVSPAPARGYTEDFSATDMPEIAGNIMKNLKFLASASASLEYKEHLARVLIGRGVKAVGGQ